MSTPSQSAGADAALRALADQVLELAGEIGMLRESMTTAAEWDSQIRTDRQHVLDRTLRTVRTRLRLLTTIGAMLLVTNLLLVVLVVWLVRSGGG